MPAHLHYKKCMNFLAHGWQHLDDPYFVAGTATPDLLNVVDRKYRVRSRHAQPFAAAADPQLAAYAAGVVRHHQDDAAFHQTDAFGELSLRFAQQLRGSFPEDRSLRGGFVGHIAVEMLLDAHLLSVHPRLGERYYQALASVDGTNLESYLLQMTGRPIQEFAPLVDRFRQTRFLLDYVDNAKLLLRINQVLRRVKLPPLPNSVTELFNPWRQDVANRAEQLLIP